MRTRIHDVLDGVRSPSELMPPERLQVAEFESTIEAVTGALRRAPVPDLAATVLAEITAVPSPRSRISWAAELLRTTLHSIWMPRPVTLRLRPAYGLGLLALLLFAWPFRMPGVEEESIHTALPAGVESPPAIYVQFRLEAPGASTVALAGSFSSWEPIHHLVESSPGVWSLLLPLAPGIHDYAFIVDGERWIADPHALLIDDGFGGANSRIALPGAQEGVARS